MKFEEILANNSQWVQDQLKNNSSYFENLSKGQSPEVLYIGCADSRVAPELFMGAKPGDVFVHRNIANVIKTDDTNVQSVIEYAVRHLKVGHVVVCGHYGCGGVQAALSNDDFGKLNPWLSNLKQVYKDHQEEIDGIENSSNQAKRFVELNVLAQVNNLLENELVQTAVKNNELKIHPWVFDIATGNVVVLER